MGHGICGGPRTTWGPFSPDWASPGSISGCYGTRCVSRSRGHWGYRHAQCGNPVSGPHTCGKYSSHWATSPPCSSWCVMFPVTVSEFALLLPHARTEARWARKEPWANGPSLTGVKPWLCRLQHAGNPRFMRIRRDLLPHKKRRIELLFSLWLRASFGGNTCFHLPVWVTWYWGYIMT